MSIENADTPVETPPANPQSEAASELAALKASLAETAAKVLANVPELLRGLVPTSLSPSDQIAWFEQAKATGIFDKPTVAPTDGGVRPAITPTTPDTASLPIYARMAAGYRN
ncbi:hypothetical protein A9995_11400 [Erythrobacter sp. QSSC1-22B]|uniref:hypothetical protein n=1 Tax=Erythrobacter sp. QSSC1-22B TaxID=1860125 RepID=UPI000804AE30|nr:hypothetical protein [Erythrobacter sp. QSSC1-22B]OBX18565.1 hypothetical protein A9995_11400 [Erythrobacter sp. QSSC1-22B]